MESLEIRKEVDSSLRKVTIKTCEPVEGQFISNVFLVPKAAGSNRFLIKMRKLNEFLDPIHFNMEDVRTVCKLIWPRAYLGSIDLKDAYFLIPLHKNYRRFVRFLFDNRLYEFTCLPFGLCTSPWVFKKVMEPVVSDLCSKSYLSFIYLDDIFWLGKDAESCNKNIQTRVNLFMSLGFIIKYDKVILREI